MSKKKSRRKKHPSQADLKKKASFLEECHQAYLDTKPLSKHEQDVLSRLERCEDRIDRLALGAQTQLFEARDRITGVEARLRLLEETGCEQALRDMMDLDDLPREPRAPTPGGSIYDQAVRETLAEIDRGEPPKGGIDFQRKCPHGFPTRRVLTVPGYGHVEGEDPGVWYRDVAATCSLCKPGDSLAYQVPH